MDPKLEREIVTYGVHHLLKDILILKSALKKYPSLTKHNEAKLVKLLLEGRLLQKNAFLKTYQQRKKNTDQLFVIMNDVLKGIEREYNTDQESTNDQGHTSALNSQYISQRYLADKYIRETIMTNEDSRHRIISVIRNQLKFQKEYEESRRRLIEGATGEGPLGVRLSKLANHNKLINETKLKGIIDQFDAEFYDKCTSMAQETCQTLTKLGIPFFSIHKEYQYPTLDQDKAYIMSYLMHVFKNEIEPINED